MNREKNRRKNRISTILYIILLSLAVVLTGCGKPDKDTASDSNEGIYEIYCLDRDENSIPCYEYSTDTENTAELAEELITQMKKTPEDVKYKETIKDFDILDVSIEESQLILTVSESYELMEDTREVLTRAAIVRTLCGIEGIDHVVIRLSGGELTDAYGQPIGPMNASQFVDNPGDEINPYENKELILYFADGSGEKLIKVTRTVEYNTNISLEKLVVEQLIAGTNVDEVRSTINPQTEIINVTVKDGTCYVNLSSAFLNLPEGIRPELTIYSIVDSLAELTGIRRVQFLIDGESDMMLGDSMSLMTQYERNLDIVS